MTDKNKVVLYEYFSEIELQEKIGYTKIALYSGLVTFALNKASKIYDQFFTYQKRKCMDSPDGRELCLKKAKIRGIDSQIQIIKSSMNQCSNTNKPDKCKAKFAKIIGKLIDKKRKVF